DPRGYPKPCFAPAASDGWSIPTARSWSANSSLDQADLAGCDHLLVPLDAYARRLWDVNLPIADFVAPLQNRVAPIQPFQKVCALRHAHDMRADLRIEMRRYGNACRAGAALAGRGYRSRRPHPLLGWRQRARLS